MVFGPGIIVLITKALHAYIPVLTAVKSGHPPFFFNFKQAFTALLGFDVGHILKYAPVHRAPARPCNYLLKIKKTVRFC